MRQCRFCFYWADTHDGWGQCGYVYQTVFVFATRPYSGHRCAEFESAGLLPEIAADVANLTPSQEALRLLEVGG